MKHVTTITSKKW